MVNQLKFSHYPHTSHFPTPLSRISNQKIRKKGYPPTAPTKKKKKNLSFFFKLLTEQKKKKQTNHFYTKHHIQLIN